MKIGITKSESKFKRYLDWLEYSNVEYEVLDFENHNEDFKNLIHAADCFFQAELIFILNYTADWDTKETKGTFSPERDGFELNLFESALEKKIPCWVYAGVTADKCLFQRKSYI